LRGLAFTSLNAMGQSKRGVKRDVYGFAGVLQSLYIGLGIRGMAPTAPLCREVVVLERLCVHKLQCHESIQTMGKRDVYEAVVRPCTIGYWIPRLGEHDIGSYIIR
jgi:hypothetical protein